MTNHPTQDPPRCPKCSLRLVPRQDGKPLRPLVCANADHQAITDLEEVNAALESQVSELSRQLDEAKAILCEYAKLGAPGFGQLAQAFLGRESDAE